MHELITIILSLPDFNLPDEKSGYDSESKWQELSEIISGIEAKNAFAELQTKQDAIKEFCLANKISILKLINFLNSWFEMTLAMCALAKEAGALWKSVTHDEMSADSLLPLTIEALPNDLILLGKLREKIDKACRVVNNTDLGYTLINLHSAIQVKFRELAVMKPISANQQPLRTKEENKIVAIANEIAINDDIKKILPACEEFKNVIRDTFIELFKEKEKGIYLNLLALHKPVQTSYDNQALIDLIFDKESKHVFEIKNPELVSLRFKYFMMHDMHYSLTRTTATPSHKLSEFVHKFNYSRELLFTNDQAAVAFFKTTGYYIGMNRLFDTFSWRSKEENFLAQAGLFSRRFEMRENANFDLHHSAGMQRRAE